MPKAGAGPAMDETAPPAVSLDDLRRCGVEAITAAKDGQYIELVAALGAAVIGAQEAGDADGARTLNLLAGICRIGLDPLNRQQPFQPFMVMRGQRSFMPEDLLPGEMEAIRAFYGELASPLLRSRLADIVWVYDRPKNVSHALEAIKAYIATPPEPGTWFEGNLDRWSRAIVIAREVKAKGQEYLAQIEQTLLRIVVEDREANNGLVLSAAHLLLQNRLGVTQKQEVAKRLQTLATASLESFGALAARSYFHDAAVWYRSSEQWEMFAQMVVAEANTWIAEAELNERNATNGYLVAGVHYEQALQLLRSIPRKLRDEHGVEGRMRELRERISAAHEQGLELMEPNDADGVDITELVEFSRKAVTGKSWKECILEFCRLVQVPKVDVWQQQARELARKYPMQSLFSGSQLSSDGRTTARYAPLPLGDGDAPEWAEAIRQRAVQNLTQYLGMCVQGSVLPALEVLNAEHRPGERDVIELVARSPVVPRTRVVTIARGLLAGFRGEFDVASHLLVPQLENLVRFHLRAASVQTRIMDEHGIEMEMGLSRLMDMPAAQRLLGDLAFELNTVFCDAVGFNLRNEIAHGLLDDDETFTIATVYAWWFVLRLVMLPFLNAQRGANDSSPAAEPEAAT